LEATDNVIELKTFLTWMEDGIVRTEVKKNAVIQVDEAKENVEAVREITAGITCPILVDMRQIKSISKEAREVFSEAGKRKHINAIALLIRSPLSKMVGNFFIGRNKPDVPTRLFTQEKQAKTWLLAQ
jgi:hypothetical protein